MRTRCVDCGAFAAISSLAPPDWRVCDECGHARAHQLLYGHEECGECSAVLMHEDEQRANLCRRCDGVEDLHERDDDEGDA